MGLTLVFVREQKTTKYFLDADINVIGDTHGFMVAQPPIVLDYDHNTITFYLEDKNFGNSMQVIRQQLDWNQSYLAKMTGLTSQYISMMEHDKKTPKDETLLKIVKALFCHQSHEYIDKPYSETQAYSNSLSSLSSDERQEKISEDVILEIQQLQVYLETIARSDDIYFITLVNETLSSYMAFANCVSKKDFTTANLLIDTITNKVRTGLKKLCDENA